MPSITPTTPKPDSPQSGARDTVAQRAKSAARTAPPRSRTFGTATATARQQFSWMWSRESILRLVLSFVLAVALWLYVTSKQDPTQAWDFPQPLSLATENVPSGYIVSNNLPPVRLHVRADTRVVSVTPSSFYTFIDLTKLRPGVHDVKVNVVADPGISVLTVTPSQVKVRIEQIQYRHVPVHWHVLTPPPAGYRTGVVRADPNTVTVSGPESVVSQVTQTLLYVDLSGARSSVEGTYKLSAEDSQGRLVKGHLSLDPARVNIKVEVAPLISYKTLPVLVSLRGQPKAGFGVSGLTVQPAEITASGSPSTLDRVSKLWTYPVTIPGYASGSFSTRAQIQLPNGVHAGRWVKVSIQLGSVEASTSIEIGLSPQNLAPGLVVHTRPASVLVTIVGPSSALRQAAGHMKATLNLSSDGAGTYQLTPQLSVPRGLSVLGVYPSQAEVVLRPSGAG